MQGFGILGFRVWGFCLQGVWGFWLRDQRFRAQGFGLSVGFRVKRVRWCKVWGLAAWGFGLRAQGVVVILTDLVCSCRSLRC